MSDRFRARIAGIVVLAALPLPAHAVAAARGSWTIASADASVTVIRTTAVLALGAGASLRADDLIEAPRAGVVQLQDDHGSVLALGPQTRAMLLPDARVVLLQGWLKLARSCEDAACPQPRVETARGTIRPGANAAAVVAASVEDDHTVSVFSESGVQTLALAPPASLSAGSFAALRANAKADIAPRAPSAFLAAMPVAFRDALQARALSVKPPSDNAPPLRAATYDDVAPWLASPFAVRQRFAVRFRPRLADPAFRRAVNANLNALPDWRALLYPPPAPPARPLGLQRAASQRFFPPTPSP